MKRFWHTKKAIMEDSPLYDWNNRELDVANYMRPIQFNIVESLLAALPGLAVMVILFLVLQPTMVIQSGLGYEPGILFKNLVLLCVLLSLYVLIPPVFTGIIAPFAGTGSVRLEDRAKPLNRRAMRAYLYFDGAHGLYSQSTIAFCWMLSFWAGTNAQTGLVPQTSVMAVSIVAGIGILAAGIYQLRLSFYVIPRRLFVANCYSTRIRRFWQKKQPDDPPWNRYQLYYIGGGIVSGIFLGLVISGFEKIILSLMS